MALPTRDRLQKLIARQGNRCALCELLFVKGDAINTDHIVPVSKGGRWEMSNLQATHQECNTIRGSMSMAQWRAERSLLLYGIVKTPPPFTTQYERTIQRLSERIIFLERANTCLAADRDRLKREQEEIVKATKFHGTTGGGRLPEHIKARLADMREKIVRLSGGRANEESSTDVN